ncbi:MAG: DUF975 family protein [Clostridiales Family XIII bacterium]|jgi:uncharacterized membrane protein|nr:DUF975 family protein [Clostridiales Family XIII bacterium]
MNYQQLIITEPVSNFRTLARNGIRGRWGDAFLKGALYVLILGLPAAVIQMASGQSGAESAFAQAFADYAGGLITYPELVAYSDDYSKSMGIMYLYQILVAGALTLGITQIYLRYRRMQQAPYELLFSGFSNYGRAFGLFFLQTLFILLWSLLLIIPGIIAFYRYRLAFCILADNPQISPLEAINISKGIMQGNKWKAFCLDLSFIGWYLLASFAASLVMMPIAMGAAMAGGISGQSGLSATPIISIVSLIAYAFAGGLVDMYQGTSVAAFYERASGILKYHDEITGLE